MAARLSTQWEQSEAQKPQKLHTPQWVSLVAGGIAGGVEAAVTSKRRIPCALSFKSHGIKTPGTTAKAAVRFVSYDTIRNSLSDERGVLSAGRGMLAGTTAGAVESVLAVTPTERIKTALIDNAKGARQFKSSLHATSVLFQRHGISELYRGLLSTTIKQSATSAVRMGTYNMLKEATISQGITPSVFTTFGIGAMAGVFTVYATQPFDTIKTRAQGVQGAGVREAVRSVIRDYGVRGFWKGSSMRLGRLLLSGGIVFSVYEGVSAILSPRTHR